MVLFGDKGSTVNKEARNSYEVVYTMQDEIGNNVKVYGKCRQFLFFKIAV